MAYLEDYNTEHRERQNRLFNPPNAVPDHGITMVNGRPWKPEPEPDVVALEPEPEPPVTADSPDDVIELALYRLIRQAQEIEKQIEEHEKILGVKVYRRCPPVEAIQRVVAKFYQVPLKDILSPRRHAKIVWPRQVAMYLCKVLTARSLPDIGRRCGDRDHTTVMHAVRKVAWRAAEDERLRDEIQLLIMKICEATGCLKPMEFAADQATDLPPTSELPRQSTANPPFGIGPDDGLESARAPAEA